MVLNKEMPREALDPKNYREVTEYTEVVERDETEYYELPSQKYQKNKDNIETRNDSTQFIYDPTKNP